MMMGRQEGKDGGGGFVAGLLQPQPLPIQHKRDHGLLVSSS